MSIRNKVVANKRLLVVNRGEIAIRIFRAATELNMTTIAVYSHEDRFSVHRFKADEAWCVGQEGDPLGAYLNWQALIELAKAKNIDAIHPGYGFLSENADFARACEEADIMFCGPGSAILERFGDKLLAKKTAREAGIPVIPGSDGPVADLEEARHLAAEFGYPVTLKALSGGGGKGIRIVGNEADLEEAWERVRGEARSSFGRSEVYLEKTILNPRHVEVQIAGDATGTILHLFERDCSIQRRHQKVIEVAPALGISDETRRTLHEAAVRIGKHIGYVGVGTVEFLIDERGNPYFLEVNPRIQVEHTVTEMVTGFDLVQASIMLVAGRSFDHPAIGVRGQQDLHCRGVAIQCRITTEDPRRDFSPDTGTIVAYRPAQGFGIRLDEGFGTSGGLVTPFYDSLLVKVTAHALDLYGAAQKMTRALKEFRIRGVRHNIPLLINIVTHKDFIEGRLDTGFFSKHPEVFRFPTPRDRATKLLRFLANATINNPHNLPDKTFKGSREAPRLPAGDSRPAAGTTAKSVYDREGAQGLVRWIQAEKQLFLTDTTMRDAHQSLFATRLRSQDIENATDFYNQACQGFFSLEVWGGATFDTSMRFLREDPWERLAMIRERIPGILLQMLLRGDNAVGYTNYPAWVIREFIAETVRHGLDLFRIFDCLNNPEQMAVALEEVLKQGAIAEGCLCYTGNILDPKKHKYDLQYYLRIAAELKEMGIHILCIKDMAGLLRPGAARLLVRALKEEIGLPVHLHTHATSGASVATLLAAAEAGSDIVDGAVSSMSGLTSQPSLNAVAASLEGADNAPAIPLAVLDELGPYWEGIRNLYQAFDPGINASSTRVYEHEIPGGQYSNLYDQARKVGVSPAEFYELTDRYREVNQLFGDLIKVTPSSKVVGDMALLLQKNNLTATRYLEEKPSLDYPDSVISFFRGHMGMPYGGFPPEVRRLVLGEDAPPPEKAPVDNSDNFQMVKDELGEKIGQPPRNSQVLSYRLYPKVFMEQWEHHSTYGQVWRLPTRAFFYGMAPGEELEVPLEPGKTLFISLSGMTEANSKGMRRVFFSLNGFPREIEILDEAAIDLSQSRPKADPFNPLHVAAPMPGKVMEIRVREGDQIRKGDQVLITESMKMEYAITARGSGKVRSVHVGLREQIEEGDLLIELVDDDT